MLDLEIHHNLGKDILSVPNEAEAVSRLKDYDFYLLKYKTEDVTTVITDHICSIPGFYTQSGEVYVNWEINKIKAKVDGKDKFSAYKHSGFVIGGKTLDRGISTFLPNQKYKISKHETSIEPAFDYRLFDYNPKPIPNLIESIDKTFEECIKKLATDSEEYGKVVIPLSGGYDSRIIAYYLKKHLPSEKLLAFTYGKRSNKEAQKSEYVAESLQIPWVFVDYDRKLTSQHNDEFRSFMGSNHRIRSLLHFQDFFAIKHLLSEGHITENSIIVPGHSGDFLFGSHIKNTNSEFYQDLIEKHYREQALSSSSKQRLAEHVKSAYKIECLEDLLMFNLRERQSKYIINSVRTYEHFKLKWHMPFWDKSLLLLTNNLSIEDLKGRSLQKRWINEKTKHSIQQQENPTEFTRFSRTRSRIPKEGIIVQILQRAARLHDVTLHFLNFHKLLSPRERIMCVLKGRTIKGALAKRSLR